MNFIISFSFFAALIATQWVWIKGKERAVNDEGNFGVIGVPSISNTPNALTNINGIQVGELFYFFGGSAGIFHAFNM